MGLITKGGILIPNNDFTTALFNLNADDIESFDDYLVEETFHYNVKLKYKHYDCPYCGGKTTGHGVKEKLIHHPNVVGFDGIIHYYARRFRCNDCGRTFFETNPFTFENFTNSYAVIDRVMKALGRLDLSIKRIAELNHISVGTVLLYLDSYVAIPRPSLPESMAIDELHSKMARRDSAYLCILIDNELRCPFDVLNSRSKHNLNVHFEKYSKSERDKVKYVTIDMWQPYKDVALRQFKNCKIAVDPFHVVKNLCDAFSKIRVTIMNQSPYGSDAYYLLKSFHFLLEKRDVNLDSEPQYNKHFSRKLSLRQIKEMIFDISDKLFDSYNLKCDYQFFNDNATIDNCAEWLDRLILKFQSTYIIEYREFSALLINWRVEIINSFLRPFGDRKLSNSLAENINGKLRTYLSLSNGIHNFTRFRKRVLLALNRKITYAISGVISSDKEQKRKDSKASFY